MTKTKMEKKAKGKEITVINKGSWSKEEDQTLFNYVTTHGEGKWQKIAQNAGLKRCGKSCRQRWLNYLKPGIKRGDITPDEEDMIIRLHRLLGNRWALIAKRLPGRTDNEIKNYWNINLSKKLQRQRQPMSTTLSPLAPNPLLGSTPFGKSENSPTKNGCHTTPEKVVHGRSGQYWSKEDSQTSPSPFTKNQSFRKTTHVINVVTPQASRPTRRVNEAIRTYNDNNTRGPGSSNQMHYVRLNNDANFPISDFLANDDDDDDDQFDDQNQFLMPQNLNSHGEEEDQNNVLPEKLGDPMDNVLDMELKRVAYFLGLDDECTLV